MPRTPFDLANDRVTLDLRTGLVLLALLFQWWDGRAQDRQQAEIQRIQAEATTKQLSEMKGLQVAQQYSIESIKVALAENGIKIKSP